MTILLPIVPPFGLLRIEEVLIRIDAAPVVFVAMNQEGDRFLFNTTDETDDEWRYLAVRVSARRLELIKAGKRTVWIAFIDPEYGTVFDVTADYANGCCRVAPVGAAHVNDVRLRRTRKG